MEKSPVTDWVLLTESYYLDDGTGLGNVYISHQKGEAFLLDDVDVYYNYLIEGVYIDSEMTTKYNEEPINDRTTLYIKLYKDIPEELTVHKVTIYWGSKINNKISSSNVNKDEIYREFYVLDGKYIPHDSYKNKGIISDILFLDLYYYDTEEAYKYEPITQDTEFFVIHDGVAHGNVKDMYTRYELVIGDSTYTLKINGTKTDLSSYDFLCKYDIYLDDSFENLYESGYDFEKLYLK